MNYNVTEKGAEFLSRYDIENLLNSGILIPIALILFVFSLFLRIIYIKGKESTQEKSQ